MTDPVRELEMRRDPRVEEALRATFGHELVEEMEPLGGGLSGATLFKLKVRGRHYVLRRVGTSSPVSDLSREIACMSMAAERGIAPRVIHGNAEQGVCITELVEGVTLGEWLRAGGDCVEMLAALFRTLHQGPAFPPFMRIPQACEMLGALFAERKASHPFVGELLGHVGEIREVLAPHVVEAPCHNDVNPGNILVSGARMWLVDWQTACAGDPFHDVATPGVFILRTPERRAQFLRAYLGREANAVEGARMLVSRALTLTFYALVFANVALTKRASPVAAGEGAPSPTGDPGRYGEGITKEALREYASAEVAAALSVLR